ncbi:MAG: hypothetical protein HKN47_20085 [Pirellulaceae bacterium]|nr:hypothetical protein [Pirellulaceae bacterium]
MTTPENSDSNPPVTDDRSASSDFENLAEASDPGIVREFTEFLLNNKKWWLAPILVIMVLLVGLVFLSASPAAPFIYSLF